MITTDPHLQWTEDGLPRSGRFGDVYFSSQDGLAETRAVFLAGCGLPEAWRGRRHFVVGELGFGTGLNVAALLALWRRERPADGRLHIFSVEAFPMAAEEAGRALGRWPELGEAAALLVERWPPRTPGFHRVDLPEFHATLDLAVMEAETALHAWSGRADAWFLDGFAPSANPQMWRDEVLALVGARSAPGARAATFTVAGQVRRGLAAQGFEVAKRPGWGRKRERLEAVLPGEAADPPSPGRVAVVGAGIAGASLARALRALGVEPALIEADRPGAGASGNAAALVTPRLDAGGGSVAALFAQALERAGDLYRRETPDAVLARGVFQREQQPRDAGRFDRIAGQDLWTPGAVERRPGGLFLADALTVEPAAILEAWLDGLVAGEDAAEVGCLAAGWGAKALADLPLAPVRGQASAADGPWRVEPTAWGGYAAPTRTGVLFGATHDRDDEGVDARPEDHGRNLETLARVMPVLAGELRCVELTGRAAVRAVTPDRLPLAGRLADGRFVLGGLGSRGFTLAPLLGEHVAALVCGVPSPLPSALATLVDPGRFSSGAPGRKLRPRAETRRS